MGQGQRYDPSSNPTPEECGSFNCGIYRFRLGIDRPGVLSPNLVSGHPGAFCCRRWPQTITLFPGNGSLRDRIWRPRNQDWLLYSCFDCRHGHRRCRMWPLHELRSRHKHCDNIRLPGECLSFTRNKCPKLTQSRSLPV